MFLMTLSQPARRTHGQPLLPPTSKVCHKFLICPKFRIQNRSGDSPLRCCLLLRIAWDWSVRHTISSPVHKRLALECIQPHRMTLLPFPFPSISLSNMEMLLVFKRWAMRLFIANYLIPPTTPLLPLVWQCA